jgi:hypothetical protein
MKCSNYRITGNAKWTGARVESPYFTVNRAESPG